MLIYVTSTRCSGDYPDGSGEYATVADAKRAIRALSDTYWQAYIVDNGVRIVRGVRGGYNATGKRWTFTDIPREP